MNVAIKLCPCCSGKEYDSCCGPFHKGALLENALQLMRSRYSAYALSLPDYIMDTTHSANPNYSQDRISWKQSILQFSKNMTFHKLEILDFKEEGDKATVTFTAFLSQAGQDATFTEKSFFEKERNRWLYKEGSCRK